MENEVVVPLLGQGLKVSWQTSFILGLNGRRASCFWYGSATEISRASDHSRDEFKEGQKRYDECGRFDEVCVRFTGLGLCSHHSGDLRCVALRALALRQCFSVQLAA